MKFIPLTGDNGDIIMNEYLKRNIEGATNRAELEIFHYYLRRGMQLLTPRQRQVVEMYYIENMTGVEIAEKLKISHQSVSKTLNTAIKKMKRNITIVLHFQKNQPT